MLSEVSESFNTKGKLGGGAASEQYNMYLVEDDSMSGNYYNNGYSNPHS